MNTFIKTCISVIAITTLTFVIYNFLIKAPQKKDTKQDLNSTLPTIEIEKNSLDAVNYQQVQNQMKDNATVPSSESALSYKDIYNEIENNNWQLLTKFHDINMKCSTTIGYSDESDFLANYSQHSRMNQLSAEVLYKQCSTIEVYSFSKLEKLYKTAFQAGSKEAEYALGILYPSGFKQKYYWLSKSVTWKKGILPELFDAITSIEDFPADLGYFWFSVMLKKNMENQNHTLTNYLQNFEKSLTNTQKENLNELSNQWVTNTQEEIRRELLSRIDFL
ncbi:hypothetical protein [Thalassotalea ganghwensis]